MTAVIDWRGIVETVLALAGFAGVVGAVGAWLLRPQLKQAREHFFAPVNARIAEFDATNTEQHHQSGEAMTELRAELGERWDRHEQVHDRLERSLGKIEGRQEAIMAGAQQLPAWPKTDESDTLPE